mgnify:CR=1 FL=1
MSLDREAFFCAKLLRTGGTSSDATLSVCVCAREPPQISSYLRNLGIPVLPPTPHLPFHSLGSAVLTCTKNGQPCRRSSTELHKREKNQNSNISRTMRVKRMTVAEGKRVGIDRFPNFHKTGSIRGMKKLYYGAECLLVRCGSYIYNVTSEPQIYNQATI